MGTSNRLHLGAPVSHPLGRLLGGLDALIGELHQTDVRRHDVIPSGNPRIGFGRMRRNNLRLPTLSVKCWPGCAIFRQLRARAYWSGTLVAVAK